MGLVTIDNTYRQTNKTAKATATFNQRNSAPAYNNPYYISSSYGGYNSNSIVINGSTGSVLPNCVGYAWGRYNEIIGSKVGNWKGVAGDGGQICSSAYKAGWPVSNKPSLGALVVWRGPAGPVLTSCGHVAVVEDVESENWICVSESNYGAASGTTGSPMGGKYFGFGWINPNQYGNLVGYVINPATAYGDFNINSTWYDSDGNRVTYGGACTESDFNNSVWNMLKKTDAVKFSKIYRDEIKEVVTEVTRNELKTADTNYTKIRTTNLLSTPSLVETPFIILKIGDYTFGSATKDGKLSSDSRLNITYPNYMNSIQITKVNGTVNQYTIGMTYQIKAGDDPNLLDRIFSSVGYGTIKISYGDWSSPSFIYKEEEAIITKLSSNIDFASSSISYTLNCTSNSLALMGGSYSFPARNAKPSDVIKEILYDNTYGLLDVFYGMKNKARASNLILSDDKQVEIQAKTSIDPLSYLNYLVTCMDSYDNTNANSVLKKANYYMTIHDDTYGDEDLNGPYFKISKVTSSVDTLATADTYEVDIGYPGDNLVTEFKLSDDNSWALLYNYSDSITQSNYSYKINNDGHMVTTYSPAIATSSNTFKMTEAQKTWWTQMTQFPVSATLTIKGLVRPSTLMTYVRVNALFYGQRHVSSGLYIITKQQDVIDSRGYRTILSLTRIAGDNDYFEKTTEEVTTYVTERVYYKNQN